jgi:UDP-N-acetylglucosamine 1-carboxyvinyltransferase
LALLSLNIEQIDRGYQNIDERLKALGAQMERVS